MLKPTSMHSKSLYYLQPNGSWKKGGDGRSQGKTLAEVKKLKNATILSKPK